MTRLPEKYYNGFKPSSGHVSVLGREGKYFFAQDQNVRESILKHQMKSIGDAVYGDGDKIEGGEIIINVTSGETDISFAKVYVAGFVREVAEANLFIPALGKYQVGIHIAETVDTAETNPDLRFKDQSFDSHNEPLAPRLKQEANWNVSDNIPADTDEAQHYFYPVYDIVDRVVLDTSPPPELSGFNSLLAKYDREANGNGYLVEGFKVSLLSSTATEFVLGIQEGIVNVYGLKIERDTAARLAYANDPDIEMIDSEPHYFNDGGAGTLEITLNRTPIDKVRNVSILEEKTVTILRGQASGGSDPLPDAQIANVVSVQQDATTFNNTSWQLIGDEIDWAGSGPEPLTGSSYQVTYQYKKSIAPDAISSNTVTVSGAVTGSQVDFDYDRKMPRIDLIKVDKTGLISRVKGVSRAYKPSVPTAPIQELILAEIHHTWDKAPTIVNVAVQAVTMAEGEAMRDLAVTSIREIARMQLILDANIANGYAKSAIFADNFDDDGQRDIGLSQDLSIIQGFLTLPLTPDITQISQANNGWTAPYAKEVVISQLLETGSYKINPYQAFTPLPIKVALTPSFDQWETTTSLWTSPITRLLASINNVVGWGFASEVLQSTTVRRDFDELARSTTSDATEMRVRNVSYTVEGFGPNEALAKLTFDGIDLPIADPAPQADANGVLTGAFTIPSGVSTGSKLVTFESATGSTGDANYIGRGQITINEMRRVTTLQRVTTTRLFDPLGYLWTAPKSMPIASVKVKVAAIGDPNNPVIMQISNVLAAQPTGAPLAEVEVDMTGVQVGDVLEFNLPVPLWVEAFTELANVWLTVDSDHALAIAELGKFDQEHGWVRRQPSVNMVTISSSNNRAFVPHHTIDLWTIIEEAKYTSNEFEVDLGTITAKPTTDLLVMAGVEQPTASTEVEFVFTKPDNSEIRVFANQPIELADEINDDLDLKAVLKGDAGASPVLFSNIQVINSKLEQTGDYISRAFRCGANKTIEITTYENTPASSQFELFARDNADAYQAATMISELDEGDGWYKRIWRITNFTADTTAIKITATGNAAHRPLMAYMHAAPLEI